MIKYLKKLWKKFFGKTSKALPENVGQEIVKHTPIAPPVLVVESKPLHCRIHNRFKKSCPDCLIAVGVK